MTQREYAKHAGVSHGYVTQLAAKGMPMHSPEVADAWRRKNISSTAHTRTLAK